MFPEQIAKGLVSERIKVKIAVARQTIERLQDPRIDGKDLAFSGRVARHVALHYV
jgi:hypothetical protein